MNTTLLILKFLPDFIRVIKSTFYNIKSMAKDGFTEKEIKDALNKIELAFNTNDDTATAAALNDQWVSEVEGKDIPPPLPGDKSTKSES